MAKIIRHCYGDILDALNNMIIAEVKAALELLPGKTFEKNPCVKHFVPICRIIASPTEEYDPRNVGVAKVWIGDMGKLHIKGFDNDSPWTTDYVEGEAFWVDITDFEYMIDQIMEQLDGNKTYNLINKSLLTAGYHTAISLQNAIEKTT